MTQFDAPVQSFDQIARNSVDLSPESAMLVCEGLNLVYASLQAMVFQYQKHHFVMEDSEFYSLHEFLQRSGSAVHRQSYDVSARLNVLGGIPAGSLAKLSELCCFTPEPEGRFSPRAMVERDLKAERAIIALLRRQAAQAESLGDRLTCFLFERMLLTAQARAFHLAHFLAEESLTPAFNMTTPLHEH